MDTLAILGIALAIITIIILSVRGLNIVIAAPLATLIVILTNDMPIFESFIGPQKSYMSGLARFLIANFAIFLLGAIFAQYMEKSNATVSIANVVLKKVGTDKPFLVVMAISAIAAFLTYGGISLFVVMFALVPLSRPIFKKINLDWSLFIIPLFFGMGTFTMSLLPGTPSVQNAVPTTSLGTTLTAAPLLSIVGTVVMISFNLWYMYSQVNKSVKSGIGFYGYLDNKQPSNEKEDTELDESKLPSLLVSVAPILVLIAIILVFSKTPHIILVALTAAILVSAVLFHKYLPNNNQTAVLSNGAASAVMRHLQHQVLLDLVTL